MPIVRKLADLEDFCATLLDDRAGDREIGLHNLKYEIAKKFGFSDYIQKSVMSALMEFGLIERTGITNTFKIIFMRNLIILFKIAPVHGFKYLINLEVV